MHQTRNSAEYLSWKKSIPIAVFLCQKLGKNSVWHYDASEVKCSRIFAMKVRRNAIGFSLWKFGNNFKHTWKASIGTTPISKPNLKTQHSLKANASSLFSIANVLKLWFYQNKGLSSDRRCGVPNTFPSRNQTSELKNQDFFPIHIRLGKTTIFLT